MKGNQVMLALLWVVLFVVALAGLAGRYGVDSRHGVDVRQLEWSVRTS